MNCLAERLRQPALAGRTIVLEDASGAAALADLQAAGASLPRPDAVVALCLAAPRALIAALTALDGRVATVLLLAPALPRETVASLMAAAGATALISDRDDLPGTGSGIALGAQSSAAAVATRWLMTTSGTTGMPKIVAHDLDGLARAVRPPATGTAARWGLLYDPSRFAGLQVVLQALLGGGVLLAPDRDWAMADQLRFLAAHGCTHLSATPTLWRRLVMLPEADALPLEQVMLGGEIADAAVLRVLAARYPAARITQIYASTEAGVGFSVHDGQPGFPAAYLDTAPGGAALKLVDGCLWIRPPGTARPAAAHIVTDDEDFVRTGDLVERRGDRLVFLGRDSGAVNIGGTKVIPEDVEGIVNGHPAVAVSRVSARTNPIVGAVLALEVVPLNPPADPAAFRLALQAWCRERLPREARPATIRIVTSIDAAASGKLSRVAA